jgi:hypothetical protein
MNRNNNQRKKSNKNSKRIILSQDRKLLASHPPAYVAQAIRSIKLRFLSTAPISSNFANNTLAGYLGVIATSAVASAFLSTAFRLKRVAIWSPVQTPGVPVTCTLVWLNNTTDFESPPVRHSDTSISYDWPAFITSSPPSGGFSSKWHDSASTAACFAMQCPQGSTVEMDFDFVLNDDQAPLTGPVLAGATLGQIYHKIANSLTVSTVNSV